MKSFFIALLFCIFLSHFSYSQNIFPSSGNVGIGTMSPQQLLNINSPNASFSQFRITNNGLGSLSALNYTPDNVSIGFDVDFTSAGWIARNSSVAWLYKLGGLLQIQGSSGNTVGGVATTNSLFTVNLSSGNVGIGTTNLPAKFNVYQTIGPGSTPQNTSLLSTVSGSCGTGNDFQNNIWLVRNTSGSDWYTIRLHDGIAIDGSFQNPQVNTRTWWERDPSQDVQSWGTAATTYLTINQGNIGIGTINTQGYKLAVNGTAIATSITVKAYANWPDYVFKKNYPLPSLTEVKTYIDQNHHLPEIPSEQQIARDGLNLGEVDKLLVKKVEELTLYLIEQNKRIEKLESQLKTINNEH